jgi:hypothetical protein
MFVYPIVYELVAETSEEKQRYDRLSFVVFVIVFVIEESFFFVS